MSETEHKRGTLKEIPVNSSLTWAKQARLVEGLGYDFEWYEDSPGNVYGDTVFYHKGRWFAVDAQRYDADDDIAEMRPTGDGAYQFECRWYNGGASFSEKLEEAFDKMAANFKGN